MDDFEDEEETIPSTTDNLTYEQELQIRLQLQREIEQQRLKPPQKKNKSKKDYNPFQYACLLVGVISIFIFIVVASMGFPLLALLYSGYYLFLSVFGLGIIWIFCYWKLAIVGYILVGIQVLYFLFLLGYVIFDYNGIKLQLQEQSTNTS